MCTGRVDLAFLVRAFSNGADGVLIGGCWPGECHYVTEGNYDALGNTYLCKKLLAHVGVSPERLRLEWIAASEGSRFAEVTTDFVKKLKELGPLRGGAGADERRLTRKLGALQKLVPYLKLVERETWRVPVKSVKAYDAFFTSEEFNRQFELLVADKIAVGEIVSLLGEGPLSTGEISERLSLGPSEVARHMNASSRRGLVAYDVERKRYDLPRDERGAVGR
jgi:F420-non-reducing hydrogenase iron-sulfur subunit